MNTPISIPSLNNLTQSEFINMLGSIFEHSPWVAQQVYPMRPFASSQQLLDAMIVIVNSADKQQRKTLICSHPELAGREAQAGQLSDDSKNEQASAGLDNCSSEELQTLRELNTQYRNKFDFPFVIAVKQLTRYDILDSLQTRLQNPIEVEFDNCIQQVGKIAEFRLKQLIIN